MKRGTEANRPAEVRLPFNRWLLLDASTDGSGSAEDEA